MIRPAGSSRHWRVTRGPARARTETISWKSQIEHPDAWLLPIPPLAGTDSEESSEPEEREAELVLVGGPGKDDGGALP